MQTKEMNDFFKAFTYSSKYRFLEEAKDKDELQEIAEKRGLKLPAIDLAIFKCEFFYLDQFNKNNCKMERAEVEGILDTLVGKQIDINHYRKKIVGHWLDAHIEENTVIAYGAFFKESLSEDYQTLKEMMEEGSLYVSMEAWGVRDFNEDGKTYSLRDCEMSGGALLLPNAEGEDAPPPAFPGAAVLELSKKYKNLQVLEFASMQAPKEFFHEKGEDKMDPKKTKGAKEAENSNYSSYEMDQIARLMWEVICPSCKDRSPDIMSIDFEKNKVKAKCYKCESILTVDLTPPTKVLKKGRKVKNVAMEEKKEEKIEDKKDDKSKEVNKPIEDKDSSKINKEETSMDKLLKKFNKSTVEEVLQEIAKATIERELSKEELEKSKVSVDEKAEDITEDNVKDIVKAFVVKKEEKKDEKAEDNDKCEKCENKDKEIAGLKSDLAKTEKKVDEYKDREKAAKEAADEKIVKDRKEALGEEIAKDMKDEDLLNDDKFEIAKLKKENAKLKKDSGIETASEEDDDDLEDGVLEMGAEDKEVKEGASEKKGKTIRDIAFGDDPVEKDCDDGKIG